LGEVKLYDTLAAAIRDVTAELKDHLDGDFLRAEFMAITNKLDPAWPHTAQLADMLDRSNSLDEIKANLVMPVLLTYDSSTLARSTADDQAYRDGLLAEAEKGWNDFTKKLSLPLEITLHLILMPLQDKARLARLMHEKLKVWQHI